MRMEESITGELAVTDRQIVASRNQRIQSKHLESVRDDAQLAVHVIEIVPNDKREVQISQIVINGTATASPPNASGGTLRCEFVMTSESSVSDIPSGSTRNETTAP